MVTDRERAVAIFGRMVGYAPEYSEESQQKVIESIEAELAAVRAERDAEWSAAAVEVLPILKVFKAGNIRMLNNESPEWIKHIDALNALIEEVKPCENRSGTECFAAGPCDGHPMCEYLGHETDCQDYIEEVK